jgi:hypothetical protein
VYLTAPFNNSAPAAGLVSLVQYNSFGLRQTRVVVVEKADPARKGSGAVQVCTGGGKVKRTLSVNELCSLEELPATSGKPADSEDFQRSLVLLFKTSATVVARRQLVFVSKRQRDGFVEQLELMRHDLTLQKPGEGATVVPSWSGAGQSAAAGPLSPIGGGYASAAASASAAGCASGAAGGGAASSGSSAALASSLSFASTSTAVDDKVRKLASLRRFAAMESKRLLAPASAAAVASAAANAAHPEATAEAVAIADARLAVLSARAMAPLTVPAHMLASGAAGQAPTTGVSGVSGGIGGSRPAAIGVTGAGSAAGLSPSHAAAAAGAVPVGVTPGVDLGNDGIPRFFALEENEWGYGVPSALTFSADDRALHVIDASNEVAPLLEYPLRRIAAVLLHEVDKTAAGLDITDGALTTPRVVKRIVLLFGSRVARQQFLVELLRRMDSLCSVPPTASAAARAAAAAAASRWYRVADDWRDRLPTQVHYRFEASRVCMLVALSTGLLGSAVGSAAGIGRRVLRWLCANACQGAVDR